MGAAKGSAAGDDSCTGVRDGNGEREAISKVCGGTTVSTCGPCALAKAVATETATNVSANCFTSKAEKIFINDFCAMCILSPWTCTFASGFEEGNGPKVSSSPVTKATARGAGSREKGSAQFLSVC